MNGSNGSGKSNVCRAVYEQATSSRSVRDVRRLCPETERAFRKERGHERVSDILGGLQNAQDTIVRFGLVNIWHRRVSVLSTGEMRKLSLACCASSSPELFVLDSPYDGLDAQTRRILRSMIEEMSEGMVPLLVSTHAATSCGGGGGGGSCGRETRKDDAIRIVLATNRPLEENVRHADIVQLPSPTSPFLRERGNVLPLVSLFHDRLTDVRRDKVIVHIDHLSVFGKDDEDEFTILDRLDWKVRQGDVWQISGGNGSGKSTLMRILLRNNVDDDDDDSLRLSGFVRCDDNLVMSMITPFGVLTRSTVGLKHVSNNPFDTVQCAICRDMDSTEDEATKVTVARTVANAVGIDESQLDRSLSTLSDGELQMVQFGRVLAARPSFMIVDEGLYGLDEIRRGIVRDIMRCLVSECAVTIAFITHHDDERLPYTTGTLDLDKP